MARLPRLAVPGECHLVVQRAHNGEGVFAEVADREAYLAALTDAAAQHGLRVYGYGLADAQALLLVEPEHAGSLSLTLQALGRRYVAAYNRHHQRRGTLWDGRFRAGVVESPRWVIRALVFAETSVLPLGDAALADASRTSLPHHTGSQRIGMVSDHSSYWALGNTPFDREAAFSRLVGQGLADADRETLAHTVEHGWALGTPAFVAQLAAQTLRPLQPRPRGRPRRSE